MILDLDSFSSIPVNSIPFIPVIPSDIPASAISLRIHDEKWPTLRYFIDYGSHRIRIKEFFMDWFFTGFPKALMSSFADAYSEVSLSVPGAMHIYSGKNYRNCDSASVYYHGTTIEAESSDSMKHEEFVELFTGSMAALDKTSGYVNDMQFHERSFFASGHHGQWYEDERIARLSWQPKTSQQIVLPGGEILDSSGFGVMKTGKDEHCIAIFQNNAYNGVLWLEAAPSDTSIPYAYYRLRKGEGLFNEFVHIADDCTAMLMEPYGPQVVQFMHNDRVITAALNPGIKYRIRSGMQDLKESMVNAVDGICRM
ncbi:MAG: hypothetical protein M1592_05440 [Candidatus Thermoplasmatota archaeon]|jgi:hypothetical protein|nr:hypothetical protein [Candidatus Thermoplasmatota archaeon]